MMHKRRSISLRRQFVLAFERSPINRKTVEWVLHHSQANDAERAWAIDWLASHRESAQAADRHE